MRIIEQQEKENGLEIFLDQILGKGLNSDPQHQTLYDDHTLSICITESLKVWGRIQELRK